MTNEQKKFFLLGAAVAWNHDMYSMHEEEFVKVFKNEIADIQFDLKTESLDSILSDKIGFGLNSEDWGFTS